MSIFRSCQHRQSALTDAGNLTATVIGHIWKLSQNGSLESHIIAGTTHHTLQRFDKAAATSYLAYHADTLRD